MSEGGEGARGRETEIKTDRAKEREREREMGGERQR